MTRWGRVFFITFLENLTCIISPVREGSYFLQQVMVLLVTKNNQLRAYSAAVNGDFVSNQDELIHLL